MVFDLLTGLTRVDVFNKPVKSGVTLKPGTLVVIDDNGEVTQADPSGRYAPWYVCLSDTDEPAVKAAGSVALVYGDIRIKTDNVVADTYAAGDPITVGPNGSFKKHTDTDTTPIIGYVEQVVDAANNVLIIRLI